MAAKKKTAKPKVEKRKFDDVDQVAEALKPFNLEMELVGTWLWISGDTKPHKDTLKAYGCIWAPRKGMWFWRASEHRVFNRRDTDMDAIREKYGTVAV